MPNQETLNAKSGNGFCFRKGLSGEPESYSWRETVGNQRLVGPQFLDLSQNNFLDAGVDPLPLLGKKKRSTL